MPSIRTCKRERKQQLIINCLIDQRINPSQDNYFITQDLVWVFSKVKIMRYNVKNEGYLSVNMRRWILSGYYDKL